MKKKAWVIVTMVCFLFLLASPSPSMKQGTKQGPDEAGHKVPTTQPPNLWRMGLSQAEQQFLQTLAIHVYNLPEPTGLPLPNGKEKFTIKVHVDGNTEYCFLDYYPWVYVCG